MAETVFFYVILVQFVIIVVLWVTVLILRRLHDKWTERDNAEFEKSLDDWDESEDNDDAAPPAEPTPPSPAPSSDNNTPST